MIILIGSKTNKQSQPQLPSSRDDINGIRNQFCGRPPAQSQSSYIWDVLSCCLSGFRNVIPATTAATARSDVAMREGHLYSTRVQDELSDVDQNQFGFIDQNKFEYSLLATG